MACQQLPARHVIGVHIAIPIANEHEAIGRGQGRRVERSLLAMTPEDAAGDAVHRDELTKIAAAVRVMIGVASALSQASAPFDLLDIKEAAGVVGALAARFPPRRARERLLRSVPQPQSDEHSDSGCPSLHECSRTSCFYSHM